MYQQSFIERFVRIIQIQQLSCYIYSDNMNLTVLNVSNELARNNSVYISSQLAKDPTKTVNVKINGKILKCNFLGDLDRTKIGMSKNIRTFIDTDIGRDVKVEPVSGQFDMDNDLSYLELELDQIIPKLSVKTKVQDFKIIQVLRKNERDTFFNLGETKYVQIQKSTFTLKTIKCMGMMTGDNKSKSTVLGKLLPQTQIALKQTAGSLLSIGNSQSNETNIFRPDFTIEDMGIGGLDEELFNIFRRTFASRRYSNSTIKRFGIKHVKGILLYGPPGTGKTLIARQLAKALNVKDLKIVNGPEIFSKFVGESEENIRKLFAEARTDQQKLGDKSPLHIIVFDEIDAICKARGMHGGVGGQVSDQVVNQLLTNIDGVEALNNIVVIGMTNRKDLLDEAILRPGRFEVHIEVNLPNAAGRQQIIKIHTKNLRNNKLLDPNCQLDELARLTKNFTGAEIEALIKCASSHSISRTTNILDFSKELIIDESKLRVEMQDFLKALQQVRPQFGVDQQKFGAYFREKVINFGPSFDKIMSNLQEASVINEDSGNQKRTVILYGKPGTGKTTLAINFAKHASFSYLKIISPENLVGQTEQQRIRNISKIFDDAYKTVNACIVVDGIERLIQYSPIGRRFNNSVLQALLLLLEKAPPKQNSKLLILGTTSCFYNLQQLDIPARFDIKIQVGALQKGEIQSLLKQKYSVPDEVSKKVGLLLEGSSIKNLLELAELVDKKSDYSQWQFFWLNLLTPKEQEIQ